MNTDHNLLFGVLLLHADLLDPERFVRACTMWSAQKATPLADLLVQQGRLAAEDRADVEKLLDRKLKKHRGDARAGLAEVATEQVRQSLAGVADPDVRQSLAGPTPPPPQDHVLPSTTGFVPEAAERYTLTRLHATGGIGRVWLARDASLSRDVALKELRPERAGDAAVRARLRKEALVTGQLEHPGIVPIYELGRRPEDQSPFYTIRCVRGRTLAEAAAGYHQRRGRRAAGPLDLRELLGAFAGVCNAVAYAHSRGVLHRDLKPQNVVLGDYGEVILLDWGLARLISQADAEGEAAGPPVKCDGDGEGTWHGQVLGTPAYMAPEQAEGRLDQLGAATDIYGLGAILYEILTGRPPFTGTETTAVLRQVIHQPPAGPRSLVAQTPAALEAVCLKALAKKPAARYGSAKELAGGVQRWLADEPVRAYREPLTALLGRWARRHRPLVAGAAALLFTTVIATVLIRTEKARAEANYKTAQEERTRAEKSEEQLIASRDISSRSQEELANVLMEIGRTSQAEAVYAEARDNFARLTQAQPDVLLYQRYLTRAEDNLASLYLSTGQLARAQEIYEQVLTTRRELASRHPELPDLQRELAASHHNLGRLHAGRGQPDLAEQSYRQALVIAQKLVDGRPESPSNRRSLASTLSSLGVLYRDLKQNDKAEAVYLRALALHEGLVREGPGDVEDQQSLASTYNNLGELYHIVGPQTKAESFYNKALELMETVARENSTVLKYAMDLAAMYGNMGNFIRVNRSGQESLDWYRRSIDVLEGVLLKEPFHVEAKLFLRNGCRGQAVALTALGRYEEALNDWDRAIELDPGTDWHMDVLHLSRATCLARLGDHARATSEAGTLAAKESLTANFLYDLACVYSLSNAAAVSDQRLRPDERERAATGYAAEAVRLLGKSLSAGFSDSPARRAHVPNDPHLDSLRERDDFRKLLEELENEAPPKQE